MNRISRLSALAMIFSGVFILSAVVFPIWRIELDAPQYPEGLALQIYANRLAGDVDIINGLNHYIGMKTLHAEEFIEFKILPYIIGLFGLWAVVIGLFIKSKRSVLWHLLAFLLFGILAMYDFWRWEYDYGHNLDPSAAIKVPGMSYQPPLIGFKELLNFGAYSVPDIGGWLMLTGGILIALVYAWEMKWISNMLKWRNKAGVWLIIGATFILSCGPSGPEPIILHKDMCQFCKMKISEGHFAAEVITKKGRVFKFDDITCVAAFKRQNPDTEIRSYYVHHYPSNNSLIPAETAFYLKGGSLKSPMVGNIAAFSTLEEMNEYKIKLGAEETDWETIMNAEY